ncbi:major facilitator superfamily transporter [Apiospora saccharicola]|uniref:Major facilitator superfamily transporter n=1 Tax=Apiospora saccharicola TaxID=335842 RepID=A0ABR1U1B4_9PEZI
MEEPKDVDTSSVSGAEADDAAPATIEVWWTEPENADPTNPMSWSSRKKWTNILTISAISFLTPGVVHAGPGSPVRHGRFRHRLPRFATFVVSIFVLGFACGPLVLAPLSELYGRVLVYHVTNVLFCIFTVACALARGPAMLLAFRFLSGFAGVATITIGSGTIADVMPRERRGRAVSIWSVGTILGPMVGPIIGGYVADVAGWRWMFWIMAIVVGVVTVIAYFVLEETYPPVLLERKAARLRKETGNPHYRSKLALDLTPTQLFTRSILRPTKMLLCCPIVTVMCTYVAILYGTLYLLFSTYSFVFKEVYGFSTTAAGLVFLAGGMGTLAGLAYIANFSDRSVRKYAAAGKPVLPEARLPLVITVPGALTFPLGLFVYGWSAEARVHWIVPQIGTAITGFGSILVFVAVQTYLIDAFEGHAASVVGANAVLRGLAGALIPLGGLGLYEALGWGWGNSLLGFVALLFAPILWILGAHGARIRDMKSNKLEL